MKQSVGIILSVENPLLINEIQTLLKQIPGVNLIYITNRNDKKLYVIDEIEFNSFKGGNYHD